MLGLGLRLGLWLIRFTHLVRACGLKGWREYLSGLRNFVESNIF